jgi:hypothetical protein
MPGNRSYLGAMRLLPFTAAVARPVLALLRELPEPKVPSADRQRHDDPD